MSIKDEELYPKYLIWLESKKNTVGGLELSKISKSLFEQFKFRYTLNPTLKEKIDNSFKQVSREEKIDEVFEDEDDQFDFDF